MALIDAHTHMQTIPWDHSDVQSWRLAGVAICATNCQDWENTALAASRFLKGSVSPDAVSGEGTTWVLLAVGTHPFWAIRYHGQAPLNRALVRVPRAIVGEIGLDKSSNGLKRASFDTQVTACKEQLLLAASLGRPVVLHCVRSTGILAELLVEAQSSCHGLKDSCESTRKRWPGIPVVMIHAYGGSVEGIRQLTAAAQRAVPKRDAAGSRAKSSTVRVLFGFTAGMLSNPRAKKARASAAACPVEQLLLETDSPDQAPLQESIDAAVAAWEMAVGSAASKNIMRGSDAATPGALAADDSEAAAGGGGATGRGAGDGQVSSISTGSRIESKCKADQALGVLGVVQLPERSELLSEMHSASDTTASAEASDSAVPPTIDRVAGDSTSKTVQAGTAAPSSGSAVNVPSNVVVALHVASALRGCGMVELAAAVRANFEAAFEPWLARDPAVMTKATQELKECLSVESQIETSAGFAAPLGDSTPGSDGIASMTETGGGLGSCCTRKKVDSD